MDIKFASTVFAALAQPTRLDAFRLLVKAGPSGMSAGAISDALKVRQNTMSANLAHLVQAGLIRNQRHGRSIRYFVDLSGIRALLTFLLEDCCGGTEGQCAPLFDDITCAFHQTPDIATTKGRN